MLLLLVHEMGHVIQLRREGIDAGAPMFIPFLGALVAMKELPKDAAAEARVGLAGPVLGSLAALVPLAIYAAGGSDLFLALAFVGFLLNLFNLLPGAPARRRTGHGRALPLDVVRGLRPAGGGHGGLPEPGDAADPAARRHGDLAPLEGAQDAGGACVPSRSRRTRLIVAGVYIGLALALALGMDATHLERDFSDV